MENLIKLISQGNAKAVKEVVTSALNNKLRVALENKKIEVAKNTFSSKK